MPKKILLLQILFGIGFVLLMSGCQSATSTLTAMPVVASTPTSVNHEITDVIFENVAAMNARDIVRYMATIHPKSMAFDNMQTSLQDLFNTYDLNTVISDVKLISVNATEARVGFVLITTKVKGPEFKDNKVTGEFILQKDGSLWKIFSQDVKNIEYLTP